MLPWFLHWKIEEESVHPKKGAPQSILLKVGLFLLETRYVLKVKKTILYHAETGVV